MGVHNSNMLEARPYVLLILLFIVAPASSDDTIDILKQTLGRLNMAYQKASQSKTPADIEKTIDLVSSLTSKLDNLKAKLKTSGFETAAARKAAVRGTLTEIQIIPTGQLPKGCKKRDTPRTQDGDWLKVHYVGKTLHDGKAFDSSFHTGSLPVKFMIGDDGYPKGWSLGMLDMCEGERRQLRLQRSSRLVTMEQKMSHLELMCRMT